MAVKIRPEYKIREDIESKQNKVKYKSNWSRIGKDNYIRRTEI